MKNFKNNLKKNKKGFTLVEIIVVLVILAVLAAAAIPTMLGFVEDSKGKAEIANARAAYVACQSIATEEKASGKTPGTTVATDFSTANTYVIAATITADNSVTNNKKLNQMLGTDLVGASVKPAIDSNGKVTSIQYLSKSSGGYKVTITTGSSTVVEKGGTIS